MNIDILVTGGIGLVTSIVSGWASWLFARRKYNTEVDHNLIENMKDSLEFYRALSDDNKERLKEANERCNVLEEELAVVNTEITNLRKQMLDLTLNICMDLTCKKRQRNFYIKSEEVCDKPINS